MKKLPYLLMFALINSCIELEVSAPSFPSIMSYFSISENTVGLTITLNLVGFCIAALIYGPLSDVYGRRRVMLLGNGILAVGAAMCVFAPSIDVLLVARFVQGFGAATSAVVVSAIIADIYSRPKAARLYGIMNAVFSSIMALAPVLGGFINNIIGWRGNYGVIAGISITAWLLLVLFLPETLKNRASTVAPTTILTSYKKIITSGKFFIASSIPSILYGCYMAFIALSPFIYLNHINMFLYTMHIAMVVFCFAASSLIVGKITKDIGTKRTLIISILVQFIGAVVMCFANTVSVLTTSMSIFAIGFAFIYPIVFAYSMEIFPKAKGTASSVIMSLRYFICAALTFIANYNFNGSILSLAKVLLCCATFITVLGLYSSSNYE